MDKQEHKKALLLIDDGLVFEGKAAGIQGTSAGELCFNTGMTGYQEVFTDPSYFGQLLITTNVHIGNYGVKVGEEQSNNIQISGLICKDFTELYSRKSAYSDIDAYFKKNNICVIYEIDTRKLVRHIRAKGVMNGIISTDGSSKETLKEKLAKIPSMKGLELASRVTTKESYSLGSSTARYKIAVLDLGVKKNILNNFISRDCHIKVFPATSQAEELIAYNPDGFFLSNGPGDPSSMGYAINTTKKLIKHNKPVLGICLGHQVISLANGASTFKMHHGHRGINQPVKNLNTGKCEVTSQNHGFAIEATSLKYCVDQIEITHINLNDGSVEGIKFKDKPIFSVQYHPEASPGPNDSQYIFDEYISLLNQFRNDKNKKS